MSNDFMIKFIKCKNIVIFSHKYTSCIQIKDALNGSSFKIKEYGNNYTYYPV